MSSSPISRRSTSARFVSVALAASLVAVLLPTRFALFVPRVQAGSADIVISHARGNDRATYMRDFVEPFNRGMLPVSPSEKPVQYTGATGTVNFAIGSAISPAQTSALRLISQVQGSGTSSPLAGQTVTVQAIVTLLKSNGFFLQEEVGQNDTDPNTSEGVFVFTSASPTVSVGDQVTVTGTASEFNGMTEISASNTNIIINSTGNALPTAVTLTPADLPPTANFAQPQLEKYEGMRLFASSLTTVAPNDSFFDVYTVLTGQPRPMREPGIPVSDPVPPDPTSGTPDPNIPRWDENPERLLLDTNGRAGSTGETLTSNVVITNVTGPLDYTFGAYRLINESPLTRTANMSAVPVPTPTASEFTVASYNIENFNNSSAIQRQKAADTVRNLLHYPDVIGLIEIDDPAHLQALRDEINNDAVAAGHPNPLYAAYLFEGNGQGGNVSQNVGFLIKTTRISVMSVTQERKAETYTPPGGMTTFLHDRPPLVLDAIVNQTGMNPQRVLVVLNHLRSFVDVELVGGAGPGAREKRKKQAESLADLLNDLQTANPGVPVISVGDYNAFQFNNGYDDPISVIKGTPRPDDQIVVDQSPDLVNPDFYNLTDDLPASERYTFIFEGTPQALDHHLVNTVARALNTRTAIARVNADFPEVPAAAFALNASRPERSSDHDPVVSYYALNTTPAPAPSLSINDVSHSEGNSGTTTFTFNVTLSSASNVAVTVDYQTTNGMATAGSDYQSTSGTITFNPGELQKTVTVLVNGDTQNEFNETFFINLSSPQNATVSDSQGLGTILNDDSPAVQFSSNTFSFSEGMGHGDIIITRTGDLSQPLVIDYRTSDQSGTTPCQTNNTGFASDRCDYATAAGSLQFAAGEAQKTIPLVLIDDAYVEPSEQLTIILSNPQGAILGSASTATVSITDNDTQAATQNPIDDLDFFIRQLYVDFLGREPDAAGFQFWKQRMTTSCPADQTCDRIDSALRFFSSDEFRERGYFVYLFYHAALGRRPTYSEWMLDVSKLNGAKTVQEQETAKQAFINEFMTRQEFMNLYNGAQTGQAFVDALIQQSGTTPDSRQQLIDNYATVGRARTLRAFIKTPEVQAQFVDRAFVTMLYFGFLRRDAEPGGFSFWMQKLNETNKDYRFLIKGFLDSDEYRFRFAQIPAAP